MAGRERRQFGGIRKLPSGRYQARYYDAIGTRHTAPHTFAAKADAARYLAVMEADMTRGAWIDPRLGRTTFEDWVGRWWEVMTNLRPTSRDLYEYLLRRFLLPTFERVALVDIDTLAVRSWLAAMEREGRVGASTRAKAYRLLSRILAVAVEGGYLLRNPCTVKGAGIERAPEMAVATVTQVAALAAAVPSRCEALILVAAYGGLRWGELAGLTVKRIDAAHAQVHVVEQVTEVNGHFLVGPPKTDAGRRAVALPAVAAVALHAHLTRFVEGVPDALVFPATEGGFMRRSNFRRRVWLPATEAVGLPGFRFHDLRHTAATLALTAGANPRELMARIGHASPTAAMRYQHVLEGRDSAIAGALDQLVQAAAALALADAEPTSKGTIGARETENDEGERQAETVTGR